MNVTFACPECREPNRAPITPEDSQLSCAHCQTDLKTPSDALSEDGAIQRCLVCHSDDLFTRKDFPQKIGVAIVATGFIGFIVAQVNYNIPLAFGFLIGSAIVDLLLFLVMGEALVCYRCDAHYRNLKDTETHSGFDLEIHERYRQVAARQAEAQAEAQAGLPAGSDTG